MPPISANATNNVAMWLGGLSSAGVLRSELHVERPTFVRLLVVSALGSVTGAIALLRTSNDRFTTLIPVLLFAATALFIAGPRLTRAALAVHRRPQVDSPLGIAAVFAISVYGGFFGAAMGILLLASLGALGMNDARRANALKLALSVVVNGVAVVPFVLARVVAPGEAAFASVCAVAGGVAGARLVRRLPARTIRAIVVVVACAMTAYFTWKTYVARA